MRKFLGGVFLLLIVLGVGLGIAVSNLDSTLNDNKAWVEEQIEAALVRPVSFDEVGLSFTRGFGVRVANFRIGEDPDYGEGDFFVVEEASLRVAIWPALFGRIEVTRIAFEGVTLVVVNDVFGMNTDTLGGAPTGAEQNGQAGSPLQSEEQGASALDDFTVAIAEIRGGRLRYVDRTADPVASVEIERLAFTATDVGLGRPVVFRLSGELLGEDATRSNLELAGRFGPLPELADVPTPLDIRFEIDPIRMDGLRELPVIRDSIDPALPVAGTMRLSGRVSGHVERPSLELDLDATDALLALTEEGRKERGVPLELTFDVGMTNQDLVVRSADFTLAGVAAHLEGEVKNLADPTVDLHLDVFDGRIDLAGGWSEQGRLALAARLEGLDLAAITRALASEGVRLVDGRVTLSLELSGEAQTFEELLDVVEGRGRASIDGGVLHDINLVEEALAGFTGVPGLSSQLPARLEKKYPALFETGQTEFDRLDAAVEVRDGRLHIEGIAVDVADFALTGDGTLSLAGQLDLGTRLALSKGISETLLDAAKPLKYLRNDAGRIEIPLSIEGALPALRARPEGDEIASRLGSGVSNSLLDEGERKLEKAFDKLSKKSKKKRKKSKTSDDEDVAPAELDEQARDLLESLLD